MISATITICKIKKILMFIFIYWDNISSTALTRTKHIYYKEVQIEFAIENINLRGLDHRWTLQMMFDKNEL